MTLIQRSQITGNDLSQPVPVDSAVLSKLLSFNAEDIRPKHLRSITQNPLNDDEIDSLSPFAKRFLEEFESTKGGLRDRAWARLQYSWDTFLSYCEKRNIRALPVKAPELYQYLVYRLETLTISTVHADIWAIDSIHHNAGYPKPCEDEFIKNLLKRKRVSNAVDEVRQRQATGLIKQDLAKLSSVYGVSEKLLDKRDLAIIALSYSCLLRCSELQRIKVRHVNTIKSTLEIPYTKTNVSGEPDYAPITSFAMESLRQYCDAAKIDLDSDSDEVLFRAANKHNQLQTAKHKSLAYRTVLNVYLRAFDVCKEPDDKRTPFTTHSCRVGACQMLWESEMELTTILKLGRWSSSEIAYRYGRGFIVENDKIDDVLNPFS